MNQEEKLEKLKNDLKSMKRLIVAYSGGVDSTFLLRVAQDVLHDGVIAVTARSSTYPEREFNQSKELAGKIGARHFIIESEELDIDGYSSNPVNRCYYCKKELFTKINELASRMGVQYVADGSNVDDLCDYRPGRQASGELNVVSPLKDAEMNKQDIRELSRKMGLETWDKPAFACLASRFPYGQQITHEKLKMVDEAEQYLIDRGFRQVRVRHHGEIARIEVAVEERPKFFDEKLMDAVHEKFHKIGFQYIALDLRGYRMGSLNEGMVNQSASRKAGAEQ
ncbi:MAG TPA: ATP-dependent sacrificial sulfur transferase LarE [Clostridia bacterium]|nr:ATP-dependent sacrificial sulfur transferase LarE [Clostridia bacterium]